MFENIIHFVYLLSLVCWIGSIVFFSFFAAPVVFTVLEREKAGEVVGVIFPRYYMIGYVCSALAFAALALSARTVLDLRVLFLILMMVCLFYAGLVVNPKARELKQKIRSAEGEEKESLESRFKSLHSLAVKLNGSILILGLGLLWMTASTLKL